LELKVVLGENTCNVSCLFQTQGTNVVTQVPIWFFCNLKGLTFVALK